MRKELDRLIELDREARLVSHIDAILGWDQETYMPPKAIEERAEQIAFIQGLAHEKATAPRIGELLAALGSNDANPAGDPSLSAAERAYLRVLRRNYDRETKLPTPLVTELARATSLGQAAWAEAKAAGDFSRFEPHLEQIVALERRKAACLDSGKKAYDVLLDLYEPGNTEASVAAVFGALRAELVALLGKIEARPQVDDSILKRHCPEASQAAISDWLMGVLSYDRSRGRLDTTEHPFTTTLGADDVRITTHYLPDFLPSSVFSTIHETGHALYELGIAPGGGFSRTSLADPASMAIHESQSRLWENMIGRSRAFWKGNYARLAALSGGALDGVGLDAFVKAINKVEPSLVRTEADEVTYGLHVILRFELEAALLSGSLAVRDLPAAWNEKMRDLVGVAPPDDAQGCLQDVHWSLGLFGYFPSYALGNLYAAQFWDSMSADLPGLDDRIESGDLKSVLGWLRTNVHEPGATYLPCELVEKVTGHALDASHFVAYLGDKYSKVYGF
jgi:carboxypeptidase Taq